MISQLFSLRLMGAKVHISLQKKECFQPAFRTEPNYWHELRDHQEYSKKIAMKTGTYTQVPVPMTN